MFVFFTLELDNQALKSQVQLLLDRNTELVELLEKNNISIPQSLKHSTKDDFKQTSEGPQTLKPNDSLNGTNNIVENTNVTWSSSGIIPMSTTTTTGQTQLNSLTSIGTSSNYEVSSAQPSFSMYTVSSIMNGSSPNVSLVNSSAQNNPETVTLTIPVQATAAASSGENATTGIPIMLTTNGASCSIKNLVTSQNINTKLSDFTTASNGALGISTSNTQQGTPQGRIRAGNPPQSIMVDSSTQAVTQVVLCQGTTMNSIPNGSSGTSFCNSNTLPAVGSLSNNTGIVMQNQGPIMTLGSSNLPLTTSANRSTTVAGRQLNTAIASSTAVPVLNLLSNNSGMPLSSHVVSASSMGTPTQTHLMNRLASAGSQATASAPSTIPLASHSLLTSKGPLINAKGPAPTIGATNLIQPLKTNNATVLVNKGLVSNGITGTPVALPSSLSLSNTGLVIQTQSPIFSLGTPCTTQTLSTKRAVVNSVGAPVFDKSNASGLVNVLCSPAIPALATNTTGIITGTPISMTPSQTPSANIQVIPAPIATQTNPFNSNTNPVTLATNGVVNMNIPTAPVGPNTTQQPGLVTLKLPKTTIQPVSGTSMTSNRFNTGTSPNVNLTPSPGTAFVIVRSAPCQQTMNYSILPTQSVSNYPSTSVVQAKSTPTAIVQPTIQQPSGPFQIPFTVIPASTSTSPGNAVTATRTLNSSKRSHATSVGQTTRTVASSPQPPAKVAKNGKKRQSNKASSGSKAKASKQKTNGQSKINTSASPSVNTVQRNGPRETRHNTSNTEMCQQDMLSSQTFNISSLIPDIQSPNKSSPAQTSITTTNLENKKTGGGTSRSKTQTTSTSLRLSHSIDALTGRRQEQTSTVQQLPQQNILSFSAESLLGSGDDLVSSLQTMSCTTANNAFTPQSTLTMTSFQDNPADGNNPTFSNFSAEALISETDFMGIANDNQSSRLNFAQGTQSVKSTPGRTQMFSDFSAESLINTSDLGSGLSYAIDNLISRSDNNDNNIAMTTVNPNLLHSNTSNILQDNIGHSLFTHSTSVPKNFSLSTNTDFQNATTDSTNINFTKYNGFTSPQKQSKDIFSFKPNSTLPFASSTSSPTYLKHSVDSITASQYNTTGSSAAGIFGSSIGANTLTAPSFNSLFSLDQQQFQSTGNPFSVPNNLTRTSYQGPTMGSYA